MLGSTDFRLWLAERCSQQLLLLWTEMLASRKIHDFLPTKGSYILRDPSRGASDHLSKADVHLPAEDRLLMTVALEMSLLRYTDDTRRLEQKLAWSIHWNQKKGQL